MISKGRAVHLILAVGMLAVAQEPALLAQEARATVVGRVVDSTGGVIPGASVDVINQAMGTKLSLTTNAEGFYQATYLIPGLYRITAEVPGFKKFVRDNLEIQVNDRLELNIVLEIGGIEQTVTVNEETPLLNTASASAGQVVDARRISDLPVPHGNPFLLIGQAAGATFMGNPKNDRASDPTGIVGYAMDGTKANRSDVTIDGVSATSTSRDTANEVIASYVPPSDIVAEFRVQTATFDAAFGQTEGGVTNISLKSGTGHLHGTAYFTKMLPDTFANDFFANKAGIPRADFYYNRWGGSAGGPVWIPRLYDGRDRTFFMWGYEGLHESRPRSGGTQTVPTPLMRQGNLSELLALGTQYQIYNPFTRILRSDGKYEQQPFAGNIIPQSLINPVAKKLLEYYPDPLVSGSVDKSNNYPMPNLPEIVTYWNQSLRVDHVVSNRQRLFARASVYRRASTYNNYFGNLVSGQSLQFLARTFAVDDVYTLNPITVLNFRYGYNRSYRENEFTFGHEDTGLLEFSTAWTRGPFNTSAAARPVPNAQEKPRAARRPGVQAHREDGAPGRLWRLLRLPGAAPRRRNSDFNQTPSMPQMQRWELSRIYHRVPGILLVPLAAARAAQEIL